MWLNKALHKSRFRYGVKYVFPVKEFKSAINLIHNFQSHSLPQQALV